VARPLALRSRYINKAHFLLCHVHRAAWPLQTTARESIAQGDIAIDLLSAPPPLMPILVESLSTAKLLPCFPSHLPPSSA
jgi:hypothetical protein